MRMKEVVFADAQMEICYNGLDHHVRGCGEKIGASSMIPGSRPKMPIHAEFTRTGGSFCGIASYESE